MARHNDVTTACFKAAMGITPYLQRQIEARLDGYNSGDITADWASAVQDQMAEEQRIIDAIREQLIKAQPPTKAPSAVQPGQGLATAVARYNELATDADTKNDVDSLAPAKESIDAKPGANIVRMAKLLGPKLYGSPSQITSVSVKEIFQNSFDAVKGAMERGLGRGKIDIKLDKDNRTIRLVDNGSGMTPSVLANQFLQIAGTNKDSNRASGGLGIAKMLFLYGNQKLDVITARDGKVAVLRTTGDELMASLDGDAAAPKIDIMPLEGAYASMFPDGHGTLIEVKVPETYVDPTDGNTKYIAFDNYGYDDYDVLTRSPLFGDIDVTYQGRNKIETVPIGANFPVSDFTQLANVKFAWGTAHIYVSQKTNDANLRGDNLEYLSNGLWQFSGRVAIGEQLWNSKNVPRKFYVDITPTVRPEDAGYPFDLNRQQFSKTAAADMNAVGSYLSRMYEGDQLAGEILHFGTAQYLSRETEGGGVTVSEEHSLSPEIKSSTPVDKISEGDDVEVVDGKLIVNGREIPQLTPDEMRAAKIDVSTLKIDQSQIDPTKVMLHDNLLVPRNADAGVDKIVKLRKMQKKIDELTKAWYAESDPDKSEAISVKRSELRKRMDEYEKQPLAAEDLVTLGQAAREKFGGRFDEFMHDVGDVFSQLRDITVQVMGDSYSKLQDSAIGISFDKEYRGVSTSAPFSGFFVNPALTQYTDPARAAIGVFGTMIHELAHFKVRSHDASFPAEMQDLLINLDTHDNGETLADSKRILTKLYTDNADIYNFLRERTKNENSTPRGRRFEDSQYESGTNDTLGDLERAGQRATRGPGVSTQTGAGNGGGQNNSNPQSSSSSPSRKAPVNQQTQSAAQVSSVIDKLPAGLRPLVKDITRGLAGLGRKALNAAVFTEDLLNRAHDIGMKSAKMYKDLANQRASFTGAHEREVLDVVSGYNDLPDRIKGKGPGTTNEFLYNSTMQKKWGYQPTWLNWKVDVDPTTAAAYKALGPEGMAFVDKVFELGAKTLAEKKQAVIEGATTEYNILIEHAKKTGGETEVAELEAEKIKTLKNFGSLMSISGREPYAPIKRFGNYVVQAMSPEYRAAKDAGDQPKMRELEKQEQHYYVNFAETRADAERELDKLRATGNYDDPGYRERELARDDLYGGSKTLAAIANMRNRVNSMANSASAPDAEVSKKMVKLLTDLYLTQLGEDTARKSEMNRRGIAGDIDMIRSIESQGLADARMLGSIVYSQPMMESINDMRKELKSGASATQLEKSEVFNELIARHLQALDYNPTPWASKMAKATSLWFLATSPSYYIQNATQPWMMSLPVMAAKHGYASSGAALTKAYADITAAVKNAKVFGQMDFDTLLDPSNKTLTTGEKEAIRKLLNSGRIDIGMLSELGEARVDPDNVASRTWNKIDQGMRGMQLKLEAINRVTTALASYRLNEREGAQAAYEYADDVLQQTHGDYSAWNAPRAFNTGFGKVALQFRKYQLIQLTLIAKMLKNSFVGATPAERALARRAFAYTFGQAFVVGGAKALPVPFVAAWMFAAAFGDGADEPPEYVLRQMIGNKALADVLLNGAIASTTGTNMTSIGGFGNALALAPFADFDLTNRGKATEYAFTMLSGPFGGLFLKSADSIGKIANGDLYGGIAGLAPKGVGSLMKAGQVQSSGVTKRNGDLEMSPDEITAWDTAQQALGFTPQRQLDRMYTKEADFKISRAVDTDSGRIKADYKKAVRAGDTEGIRVARREWEDLQRVKVQFKLKRSELTAADAKPQKGNVGLIEQINAY